MNKLAGLGLIALAIGFFSSPAQAGPQQGVRCPSGFEALILDGNKKLICRKVIPYERNAICPPAYNLVNNGPAPDQCVVRFSNTGLAFRISPTAPPIVLAPWQRVVSELEQVTNPNGPDKFVAIVHEFSFPEQGSVYAGDASRGVVCPAGFDGDKTHNGLGIRCDKFDGSARSADCDGIVGWEWKQDLFGDEDRCRNILTGATGPTKPAGMTKIQHDLERSSNAIGWVLNKRATARDTWQRKVYQFPIQ